MPEQIIFPIIAVYFSQPNFTRTMTKLPLFCLCLLSLSGQLPAQYTDLMNDRNISWVAEYTTDFNFNPVDIGSSYFYADSEPNNDVNVLQLSAVPDANGLFKERQLESFFSKKMLDAIRAGVFSVFEDEQLEKPIAKEKLPQYLQRRYVEFNSERYDEPKSIVSSEVVASDIGFFKVRQVFFYNKQDKVFGSRVLAIAPVIETFDVGGMYESVTPVWVKIDLPKNAAKYIATEVAYSFETKMNHNAPSLNSFANQKGRMDFLQWVVSEVAQPSHSVLDRYFQPIDPSKIQDYVLQTDTITTFDAETYEEQVRIVESNAIKDLDGIGFVQHWFFDDRKGLLFNRVVAITPKVAVKDADGNKRGSKVLFYLLNK